MSEDPAPYNPAPYDPAPLSNEDGWERLFLHMVQRGGEPLLPDPLLPQDPAFVAFVIDNLSRKVAEVTEQREEALDELEGMVGQHYTLDSSSPDVGPADPPLDSMALSDNASAMRLLAEHGRLLITSAHGRRVIGKFIPRTDRSAGKS